MSDQKQLTGYQIRPLNDSYGVFMVRVDGGDVPVDRQYAVYTRPDRTSAQVIADALNNGMVSRIFRAAIEERKAVKARKA